MPIKKTTYDFIQDALIIHSDKYNYSLVDYISSHKKVKIICHIHGIFEQKPCNHTISKQGCPKCKDTRLNNNIFIDKSNIIHNNKYDYSLVEYINNKTKIKIICKEHGIFEQAPSEHLKGSGCAKCNNDKQKKNSYDFIIDSNKIHNNKYDYSLVYYIGANKKIKIICTEHGIFHQTPSAHINNKQGCPICANNVKSTTEEFNKKANEVHNYIYDYSLVDYINNKTKIKIICTEHGIFEQIPNSHLIGKGCPICKKSKSEIEIKKILDEKNIKYEIQKTFDGCEYLKSLKFDFYLPKINTCIEFDGRQHYKSIDGWGGEKGFLIIKERDKIKTDFCKQNNIKLIRIRYDENILKKLNEI